MTMPVQQQATDADTTVTRRDVVRLLQEVGSPEQLDVSGQDLRGITLMNYNLRGANLSQASVGEANLCGANLSRADLHGADLCDTYLCWADLSWANLRAADLREADLSWADLSWADLRGAKLDGVTLYGASLARADLRDTCLDKTDVRGANLSWAYFGGASTYEHARNHLRRRGAIFNEVPSVTGAARFSQEAGSYARGFSLGLLSMSVVGLLCVVGIRVMRAYRRLKRHAGDGAPRQTGAQPGYRA
jgi:Pentapeptide repeats (8 copies)